MNESLETAARISYLLNCEVSGHNLRDFTDDGLLYGNHGAERLVPHEQAGKSEWISELKCYRGGRQRRSTFQYACSG